MTSVTVTMEVLDLRNAQNEMTQDRHLDILQGLLKGTRREAWDPGPIDGLGGPLTKAAVVAFQGANGLDADGIVGLLTWGLLIPFGSR